MPRLPFHFALLVAVAASRAEATDVDWGKMDQILGKPGTILAGGVHKWGLPRTDLKITVDGVALKPSLALGSWVAFLPSEGGTMMMGDLVLGEHYRGTQSPAAHLASRLLYARRRARGPDQTGRGAARWTVAEPHPIRRAPNGCCAGSH